MTFRRLTIGVQVVVAGLLLVVIIFTANHDFLNPPAAGLPCTTDPEPLFHGSVDRLWYLLAVPVALLVGRYSHKKTKPPAQTEHELTAGELTEPGQTEAPSTSGTAETAAPPSPTPSAGVQPGSVGINQLEAIRVGLMLVSRATAVGNEGRRLARANIVQLVLASFIGVAVVGLFYETIQVYRGKPHWPLTFFIRCLNEGSPAVPNLPPTDLTSVPTFIAVIVVAVVLGSWLWAPRPAGAE